MFSHSTLFRFLSFVRVSMEAVIPINQIKNRIEASDRVVKKITLFLAFLQFATFTVKVTYVSSV